MLILSTTQLEHTSSSCTLAAVRREVKPQWSRLKWPPGPTSHHTDKIMIALRHPPALLSVCSRHSLSVKSCVWLSHWLSCIFTIQSSLSSDRVEEEVVCHVENKGVDNVLITGHDVGTWLGLHNLGIDFYVYLTKWGPVLTSRIQQSNSLSVCL